MYSNQMGESHRRQAQDLTAEKAAIGLGFSRWTISVRIGYRLQVPDNSR